MKRKKRSFCFFLIALLATSFISGEVLAKSKKNYSFGLSNQNDILSRQKFYTGLDLCIKTGKIEQTKLVLLFPNILNKHYRMIGIGHGISLEELEIISGWGWGFDVNSIFMFEPKNRFKFKGGFETKVKVISGDTSLFIGLTSFILDPQLNLSIGMNYRF